MRCARLALCLVWLAGTGCGFRRDTNCHFGADREVFTTHEASFDDLALAAHGDAQVAVFSDANGLWLRNLRGDGQPTAAPLRTAERCEGGLDATFAQDVLYVACLRPSAEVSVYAFDAGARARLVVTLPKTGSRSRGISLVALGTRLIVGFQDAVVGESRAWVTEVALVTAPALAQPKPRLVSDPAWLASAPRLSAREGRVFGVWSERRDARDDAEVRLMLGEVGRARAPVTFMRVHDEAPSAALIALPSDFAVVFRDTRDAKSRPGLHLAHLSEDGHVLGDVLRVARADGDGRPALCACASRLMAASPRTFAGDSFVGAVGVDTELTAVSGEQQFYEDSREFAQVAASCAGDHASLLIAERATRGRGTAALYAVPFMCD